MEKNLLAATGIVAEYNPFHNGHLYQTEATQKRTDGAPIIVAMSGSFMQRGEPAFLDKWTRAEMAVRAGAALVLELPVCFSLRSAEFFAHGAVNLLAATGCVTTLSCGAENAQTDFSTLARKITEPSTQARLKELIKQGASYATACAKVLGTAGLNAPNDILALEYSKALLDTKITPLYIQRDTHYNATDITDTLASASAIREAYKTHSHWQAAVPDHVQATLDLTPAGYNEEALWQLLCYRLRTLTPEKIAACSQCTEGLENLLKQAANARTLAEALSICTKKRYSTSRIRRLFMQVLLGKPRQVLEQAAPAYLRVLAFNDTGRQLLRQMKERATLPILTKVDKRSTQGQSQAFAEQLATEIMATDIYALLCHNPQCQLSGLDYLISPSYIR